MTQQFNEWKIGDTCYRKAEKCKIIHIDFSTDPASVIIHRLSDGTEINTEFSKLTRPNNNSNWKSVQCRNNHPLQPFNIPYIGYRCDECRRFLAVNQQVFSCNTCDYDQCSDCYDTKQNETENNNKNISLSCTNGHTLKCVVPYQFGVGFMCNQCKTFYNWGNTCYHCDCNYDLCISCHDKIKNDPALLQQNIDNKNKIDGQLEETKKKQQMKQKTDALKHRLMALKHKLKQKISYCRNIVTVGCGNERCTNPYCKSNIENEGKTYSDSDASKLAVQMAQNKFECNEFPKRIIEQMEHIEEKKEEQIILKDSAANEALQYGRNIQNKQKEQNVTHKINDAVSVEDLVPYIKLLIPLNKLQNILIDEYNKVNFSIRNVNKLYMKSSPIHEILFDELLVKIIKFCNFKEYPSINLLNKQFNHIMKTHISIYNKYTLHIVCNKSLWQKNNIQFVLNHKEKLLAIECKKNEKNDRFPNEHKFLTEPLLKLYNDFYGIRKTLKHPMDIVKRINKDNIYNDLHNSFFDWSMLNKVLIDYYHSQQGINDRFTAIFGDVWGGAMGEVMGDAMGGTMGARVEFQDENVQSKMMEMCLDKMYKHILSLTIRNIRNIKLFEKDLNLSKFPKLFHLRFDLNITKKTLLCYDLSNILSLDLYHVLQMKKNQEAMMSAMNNMNMFGFGANNVVKDSGDRNICDILDIIFKSCKHLLAFKCVLAPKLPPMFPQQQQQQPSSKRTVIFPETLQFLFLSQCDRWFNIDLTKCNSLVALYIAGDNNSVDNIYKIDDFIKWPQEEMQCLIIEQTIQNQITFPVFAQRQQPTSSPAFINHFYKYFDGLKNKIENRYYNIPNIQFIKYIIQPSFIDETNNANAYNSIIKDKYNEIITIEQMSKWTKAIDIKDIMSLQHQYLIIRNQSNDSNVQSYETDLWEILLKLSLNNNSIEMYKEWFERDISVWIKNMFKVRSMS